MKQLSGRKAIVTGASRGIGRAIAQRFAAEGAEVIAVSRKIPADATDAPGGNLIWHAADISKRDDVTKLFEDAKARWGALHVLVNNAGVQVAKSIEETSEEEFDRLCDVNMKGVFFCCRQAIPLMRETGNASIVNIGSIAGNTPDYGLPLYSASKAWVHGFSKALAIEHGPDGIRCNSLAPTWTMTELSVELFQEEADPEFAETSTKLRHPLGRMAEPEDIAEAAVWLASTASGFVSGQTLSVDGGIGAAPQINPELDFQRR